MLPEVDLWVMDKNTTSLENSKELSDHDLFSVSSIQSVKQTSLASIFQTEFSSLTRKKLKATLIGVEKSKQFAFPEEFIRGTPQNLVYPTGVLADAKTARKLSLKMGSRIKSGHDYSTLVGTFIMPKKMSQTPLIITSLEWAQKISQSIPEKSSFLLIKATPRANLNILKAQINKIGELKAYDASEFKKMIQANTSKQNSFNSAFSSILITGMILAISLIAAQFYSISKVTNQELTIYKTLGATKLQLITLSYIYHAACFGVSMLLSFVYHLVLTAMIPLGAIVVMPSIQIVFLTMIFSLGVAALVTLFQSNRYQILGATSQ